MDKYGNDPTHEVSDNFSSSAPDQCQDNKPQKPARKTTTATPSLQSELPPQPDLARLDFTTLSLLLEFIIARQPTINIGTIGHAAHGKSTYVISFSPLEVHVNDS